MLLAASRSISSGQRAAARWSGRAEPEPVGSGLGMAALQLNFLGDLEVVRDGEAVALPPSRKTRALLAYLALSPKPHRREHLCELLWEVPDDPRGSLRWSLSKLRRVVDDQDRKRIVADRVTVGFDPAGADIDVARLKALAANGLETADIDALEAGAAWFRGHFLEGLDLSNFHAFHSWCVAEREIAAKAQARLLRALIVRLRDDPERALPHARALAGHMPYDEAARAMLIGLLVASGHGDEAEQQYQLGLRLLGEAGVESSGALYRAWRGAPGTAPRARRPAPAETTGADQQPKAPAAVPKSSELIGRDAELEQLGAALDRAVGERQAICVLLRGEPGIGKSRLLEAVSALAAEAGALLLTAGAFESETIRPFALWVDAVRRLPPGRCVRLFDAGEPDGRETLFGRLAELVGDAAGEGPVVAIFDDVQWADESSAAALHFVVRSNAEQPLLVVIAARDGELRDNGPMQRTVRELSQAGLLDEIRLGPLDERAITRLIETHAPAADSKRLCNECGGNPLLAVELARAESEGASGASLDDLVRERLSRFGSEGGDVLRWASVLAPLVDVPMLVRATGLDAGRIGGILETAERHAILRPVDGSFAFSHDLIGRSVYTEISPVRRQLMHRRVAELLEEDTALDLERASDLTHHAMQSGDPSLAARALVSAGRLCLRFFANDDALTLARKGLQIAAQLPDAERVCVSIELRDIAMTAAPLEDWEQAAREYVALAEQALDHGRLSHARLGYYMASYVRWMHGQWAGARNEILQSERVARGGSDEDHVVGMAEAARCLVMLERDLTHADAMLLEARSMAARTHISHHALPAALGMLRFHENALDEAESQFQDARTLAKSAGDRISEFQANEYLAMIALERGDIEAARAHADAMLDIGARLREGSEKPFAESVVQLCRYMNGEDAVELDAAIERLRAADAKHRLAYMLTRAALVDVDRDRAEAAIARACEALECATLLDRKSEIVLANAALATAYRAAGDIGSSQRHAAAALAFDDKQVARWAQARAAALCKLVDPADGRR